MHTSMNEYNIITYIHRYMFTVTKNCIATNYIIACNYIINT